MAKTPKASTKRAPSPKSEPWESRHDSDAGGPIAGNTSSLPDRSTRNASLAVPSAPSLTEPAGDEGAVPNLSSAPTAAPDDAEDKVRTRAYEIWEERGRPDGDHEEHWRQAREEHFRGTDEPSR